VDAGKQYRYEFANSLPESLSRRFAFTPSFQGRVDQNYFPSTAICLQGRLSLTIAPVDFSLREFQKSDFETLWQIDQQCFPPGISYSKAELAAYIRLPASFTIVAEASNAGTSQFLGFVVAGVNRRREGHVITIDVLPEFRRFGVGSKLLSAAEDRLRAAHCLRVKLEAAVNNTAALAFYKRHGYFVTQTMPRYYPDGLDAFSMEKNLLSSLPGK
jgi:ribosomal-protein-alanine N-acetyltransferase